MSVWRIWGGVPLEGSVTVGGSESAALAVLTACALAGGEAELTNVPALPDVEAALDALRRIGCAVQRRQDVVSVCRAAASGRTLPEELLARLPGPERAMLDACARRRTAVITDAGANAERVHFARFLQALGAEMDGIGTDTVTIRDFAPVRQVGWRVMPDRLEGCAVLCACAAAGGETELRGVEPAALDGVTDALRAMGVQVRAGTRRLWASAPAGGRLHGGATVVADPASACTSQALPLLMAASLRAHGTSVFVQSGRWDGFRLATALERMGAQIRVRGRVTEITGTARLTGAAVTANDRAETLALLAAALAADGQTDVTAPGWMAAGFDSTLAALGARIEKIK